MTNPESKAASILGRKGGQSKSEAKVQASRDNGKLGGRPTDEEFIAALEKRHMSSWTDAEMARYNRLTGQE